jgi:hypothetical protein
MQKTYILYGLISIYFIGVSIHIGHCLTSKGIETEKGARDEKVSH